ncbi:hypothetical protein ACFLZM_08090, partial [Thermodesulfobacteriota bacterium]
MKQIKFYSFLVLLATSLCFNFMVSDHATASITPEPPWQSTTLSAPSPPVKIWNSTVAYYNHQLIYAGNDNKIYAFNIAAETSELVCDLSNDDSFTFGPAGFLVSSDAYLYFHDNGKTTNIYRIQLAGSWPAAYSAFDTQCNGSIYAFTQNPWTNGIWFASAEFEFEGSMYLYEVAPDFNSVSSKPAITKQHNGGSGPIIFLNAGTLLYGESVYLGDGYFHLMDADTGTVSVADYLSFTSGLASAAYGYNHAIYVSTGNGKAVFQISGNTKNQVAITTDSAQGIVFDGASLYVSEMDDSGKVYFTSLWTREAPPQIMPGDANENGKLDIGDVIILLQTL